MQHRLRKISFGLFIVGVGVIGASAQGNRPSFEVASVKPNLRLVPLI
jgi:hypothetical protein